MQPLLFRRTRAYRLTVAGILVVLASLVAVAQRPAPDTIAATGGAITVQPICMELQVAFGRTSCSSIRRGRRSTRRRHHPPPPPTGRSGRTNGARQPAAGATAARSAERVDNATLRGAAKLTPILVTDIHEDHLDPQVIADAGHGNRDSRGRETADDKRGKYPHPGERRESDR
jgi:hypothetical protein